MKIGFVGLGKLGLDVAEVMSEYHEVTGYDIRPVKSDYNITMTNNLKDCVEGKDIVFIAVPTAHDPAYDGRHATSHLPPKDFDYSVAVNVTANVDSLVTKDTLIVMISTMLPGTVRREIAPLIKNGRFIYNPYLIAQGTVKYDFLNPEMVMIGTSDGSETGDAKMLADFYDAMITKTGCRFELGTWEEVESMKIFYNTVITAKLCLVNMIQDAAMAIGNMNVDKVTNALKHSTDRIMGPKYMTAGLGDGGGCHPRDNIALRSFAIKHNFNYDLFDAIVVAREEQANNMAKFFEKINVPKTMPVVILGSGFKPGVDQKEGSPSILVGYYLEKLGYSVSYDVEQFEENAVYKQIACPSLKSPAAYLIGWPNHFTEYPFSRGSIVVDPWRSFDTERTEVTIYHYGNTRNSPDALYKVTDSGYKYQR